MTIDSRLSKSSQPGMQGKECHNEDGVIQKQGLFLSERVFSSARNHSDDEHTLIVLLPAYVKACIHLLIYFQIHISLP